MFTNHQQRFVGRTAELGGVVQQVAALRRGAVPQKCLINICGVYGVGKSTLLAALRQRLAGEQGMRTLLLRLPPLSSADKAPTLTVKQAILRQLAAEGDAFAPGESFADDEAADAALNGVAAQLVVRRAPVVLLIDAETRSAPVVFAWVERGLLLPLVRAERVVAMITSRSPLRWREFDTRRRAETRSLLPLDLEATAQQLGVDHKAARAIYPLTFGLPLANQLARDMLAERPDPATWPPALQNALAHKIVDQIYERVAPDLTPELRSMLEVLAVVREFALPLMQLLLRTFCDEQAQPHTQALQLVTIKRLQDLDLVLWDGASLSYRVAPVLRHLIAATIRRTTPERYAAIQNTARTYYAQMLDEVLVSRSVHLVELLWHTLDGQGDEAEPVTLLRFLVDRYLTSVDGRYLDHEAVTTLRTQLEADPDLPMLLRSRQIEPDALLSVLDQLEAAFPQP